MRGLLIRNWLRTEIVARLRQLPTAIEVSYGKSFAAGRRDVKNIFAPKKASSRGILRVRCDQPPKSIRESFGGMAVSGDD